MVKYILEPKAISERCFLLEALYWIAFNKYPTTDIDLESERLKDMLEFIDDFDSPLNQDVGFFLDSDLCAKYGLPKNIELETMLSGEKSYHYDDFYVKILERELDFKDLEKLRREQKEALEYNKQRILFEKALFEYLEVFKAKLFVALREGKIKALALKGNKEYIYNKETKEEFDEEFFIEHYPDIKDEEIFYIENDNWHLEKPIEILKEYWLLDKINWENCTLDHNGQHYILIQLDTEDLFNVFPEMELEIKSLKYIAGQYILEGDNLDIKVEKRGRNPKINYEELTLDFMTNIDKFKGQKLEAVVAEYLSKYPKVGRTTLINKLSPYLKAISQK